MQCVATRATSIALVLCGVLLALASGCPYNENATCLCDSLSAPVPGDNQCFNSTTGDPLKKHVWDCCQMFDHPPDFPSQSGIIIPPNGGWNTNQYLRKYVQGPSKIPFITGGLFHDAALAKAHSTAQHMLFPPNFTRSIDIPGHMYRNGAMIMMRAWDERVCPQGEQGDCDDRKLPGGTVGFNIGGADLSFPIGGSGEEEICWKYSNGTIFPPWIRTYGFFEEFFHTMHALAIQTNYPNLYEEIIRVGNESIAKGDYLYCSIKPIDPDCQQCLDDFVHCMIFEWFASVAKVWYGLLQPCDLGPKKLCEYKFRSRAEIKRHAPQSAALMNLIFPDDNWNPCEGFDVPDLCKLVPGNAWCGKPLSPTYTGPPMDPLEKGVVDYLTQAQDVTAEVRKQRTLGQFLALSALRRRLRRR